MNQKNSSLFAFVFLLFLSYQPTYAFHIVIDPGHGGIDTGAVHGEAKESVLVLNVAQKLQDLLKTKTPFSTSMTRSTNQNLSLQDRVKFAEKEKADLFISLHANSAPERSTKGVEFFFQNNLPPDEDTLYLANQENQIVKTQEQNNETDEPSKKGDIAAIISDLQRQNKMYSSLQLNKELNKVFAEDHQTTSGAIKQAPFYVIANTSMPSVLVELGFITNPKEAQKLMTEDYQNKMALKIFSAIQSYHQKVSKKLNSSLQ